MRARPWRRSARRSRFVAAFALALAAWPAGHALAQTPGSVLVVANEASGASLEIADYYVRRRGIPPAQLLRIRVTTSEIVERQEYEQQIERPIARWLQDHDAQDRILYLVLTKDVPLKVKGTGGIRGTSASVDSELTLLYRKLAALPVSLGGSVENPFFLGDVPLASARPFSHAWVDLYLVTRLDGYTVEDAKALVDRAMTPHQDGVVILDGRAELKESTANAWLARAAAAISGLPGRENGVRLDTTSVVLGDVPSVAGYYSWGSNDPALKARPPVIRFAAGALAAEFVGGNARTFREPTATSTGNAAPVRGNHTLIGDLIRDGATGIAGSVGEPFLGATVRPDILFPAYFSGFNLVESFYMAAPAVGWQMVVVGDPLCAPYRSAAAVAAEDLDPDIDPSTELPRFISRRRVAALEARGVKPEAARLFVKGDTRFARGDRTNARVALEEAVAAEPAFADARVALAQLYEEGGDHRSAINQYRQVLAGRPDDSTALNNLAFLLATRENDPGSALPFAKRAFVASKGSPPVADTLGWVFHLLGNVREAEPLMELAASRMAGSSEVQLHAAFVFATAGRLAVARRALDAALRLEPALGDRDEVKALRSRLGGGR